VAKVVVEDDRAHAQALCSHRSGQQRRQWRQLAAEVVGQQQRRIAEVFGLARQVQPFAARGAVAAYPESKRSHAAKKANRAGTHFAAQI